MIDTILQPRLLESKDWATALFVFSFAIIAIAKSVFENRFSDFANLVYSNKYIKVYKDNTNLKSPFTISLFIVQLISFAFFIQVTLSYFGLGSKTDWLLYIQILTFLTFFILSKYLIEKIIATAFNIEDFTEQFNLQKVTYRTYIGLFILPFNIILFYYDSFSRNIPLIIIGIVLIANLLTYFISIKNYQKIILGKLFYFILYLCTLEIAPYYFMYYWFIKGNA
ncbi:protein of unknown function [Flavobacterium micromati]|uniref:DUF4271 domain-containing protein n=1 Tax=Flavobacterium micromati TaxID=229205 RepID=A0A1M5NGC7_9FLAO|nr:DUF4271 domain-containing protein [Flavobacterium micromati]SHG88542.1 protein of unknown function [Flavobacterium micromati]